MWLLPSKWQQDSGIAGLTKQFGEYSNLIAFVCSLASILQLVHPHVVLNQSLSLVIGQLPMETWRIYAHAESIMRGMPCVGLESAITLPVR